MIAGMTKSGMSDPAAAKKRPWLGPLIWSAVAAIGLAVILALSPTAREVTAQSAIALFQFFTTPFILETSVFVIGLLTVLSINQWRMSRNEDEWVYLQQHQPVGEDARAQAPPHRLDSVVWKERPEAFDEAAAETSVIEGYLALGLAHEAEREFYEATENPAGGEPALASAALAIAEWHLKNSPQSPGLAATWMKRAAALDPVCLARLPPGHPLARAAEAH